MKIDNTKALPITPQTYKQLAKKAYESLDTILPMKYTTADKDCRTFIEYTTYRPTLGRIARYEELKKTRKFSADFKNNLGIIRSNASIDYLITIMNNNYNNMYPKTAKIRDYIIDNGRLSLDKVTKSKGYNFIDKLKLLFK